VQELRFENKDISFPRISEKKLAVIPSNIAANDGLSLDDFRAWFKGYDLRKSMVIIQFTKFRY
jgi:hypothetical protein